MFHHRRPQDASKASVEKFLNSQNSLQKRLKHLTAAVRAFVEKHNEQQTKEFFAQHYYVIYQIFHDAFTVETTGKVGKGVNTNVLFDPILAIFETILVYTPELLYQRWQCNSIGVILKKLLHPHNQLRVRKIGLQCLLLWLQSLRDNIVPFAENLLASAVPEFPPKPLRAEDQVRERDWALGPEFSAPIAPLSADGPRPIEDPAMEMVECLLEGLTSQSRRLVWDGSGKHCGFDVLFHLFKKHYLHILYPQALRHRGPYTEKMAFFSESSSLSFSVDTSAPVYDRVRERIVNWLVQWVTPNRTTLSIGVPSLQASTSLASSSASSLTESLKSEQQFWWISRRDHEDHTREDLAMLAKTLYGSQENVILIHEMLRQTFRLPFIYLSTMETVLMLMRNWLEQEPEQRPEFMLERSRFPGLVKRHSEPHLNISLSEDSAAAATSPTSPTEGKALSRRRFMTHGHRTSDPSSPITPTATSDVRIGLQSNLRLFLSEASHVFLVTPDHQTLHEQVEACSQVIRLYQAVAVKSLMDQESWAHLLSILLQITQHVLGKTKPPVGESTVSQQLAGRVGSDLVKTVFVLWMNASLSVSVSTSLWDDVLKLLRSLTNWPAVIDQWKHIMKMMTRLLGQYVYGIYLSQHSSSKHGAATTRRNRLSSKQRLADASSPVGSEPPGSSLKPGGQRVSRHSRDPSISTTLAQFKGDPIIPKAAAANMPAVDEDSESKDDSRIRSQSHTTTSASFRAAKENSRRHRSETESGKLEPPKLLGQPAPSVDLTSPLRDMDQAPFGTEPVMEEQEEEYLHSAESTVSMQEYSVQLSHASDREVNEEETSSCNEDEDDDEDDDSGTEETDGAPNKDRLISTSRTNSSTTDMTESLLPEGDEKSVCSSTPAESMSSGDPLQSSSGAVTPVRQDSDHDDDLQPMRRGRASTLNSLEAKQLFSPSPGSCDALDEDEESRHLEVLAGGSRRGWTPASAAVLWRRTLGILGDPNQIADPMLHAKAISCLAELWEDLLRIRNREGEPVDSLELRQETAKYEPPMLFFAPWVFGACMLGMKYKEGQLRAYQLLCRMLLERYDHPLPVDFLSHSFRLLHVALTSEDKDLMDCVVWHSSTIFATNLPGVTILIRDYLNAAEKILMSSDSARPRREALVVLGSLLHYAYAFPQMTVHGVDSTSDSTTLEALKDKLIQMLLHTTKKEPFRQSRCLALSMLGLFVYSEYLHVSRHRMLIIECINVLLLSIRFPDHSISTTALDTILLLTHVKPVMPDQLPLKIIEILVTTIPVIINEKSMNVADTQKIVIRMLFCLLDWLMTISAEKLTTFKFENMTDVTLIQSVFQVLSNLTSEKDASSRSGSSDSRPQASLQPSQEQSSTSSLRDAADGKTQAFTGTANVPKLAITEPVSSTVQLAAKTVISHLVNLLDHFPTSGGAASFSSSVLESHEATESPELTKELFDSPCVQFFMFNSTSLLSLIELPEERSPGKLVQGDSLARIVVRDLAGKWCWDTSYLHGPAMRGDGLYPGMCATGLVDGNEPAGRHGTHHAAHLQYQTAISVRESLIPGGAAQTALTSVSATPVTAATGDLSAVVVPRPGAFAAPDGDVLQELLNYVNVTSPEVLPADEGSQDAPVYANSLFADETEVALVDLVETQYESESTYLATTVTGMKALPAQPCNKPTPLPFQNCRCLLTQLGFLNADSSKRQQFNLLHKTDQLLRELRNLDLRHCRETHKIGVVYVRHGQQDKEDILSNTAGSEAFEHFMAAMTWEVDLENHPGFKGGLKHNPETEHSTAPYFASSSAEMLFHVATRMQNSEHPGQITKLRHIGNDEILVVWSEHSRDWRRDIIKTEFGDVMIVIYPMPNGLYRIQILKKESSREGKSVPFFGPLFDGAVVDKYTLPGLVRATAINASRARRSQLAYFQSYYEERNKYIQSAMKNCQLSATLEHFTSLVIRPGSPSTTRNKSSKPGTTANNDHSPKIASRLPRDELSVVLNDDHLSPLPPNSGRMASVPSEEGLFSTPSSKFSFSDSSGLSGSMPSSLVPRAPLGEDVLTPSGFGGSPPQPPGAL